MAGSISTLGIGSGLQLQDILEQLREVDEQLVNRKKNDITVYNAQINEFTTVNNKLLSMKSAALNLSLSSNYLERTATSSDEKVFTATVVDGTAVQSQSVTVDRLATKSSWVSGGSDSVDTSVYIPNAQESTTGVADPALDSVVTTTGTLVINSGDSASPTAITVDVTAGMTMDQLVAAINEDDENGGVGSPSATVTAETYVVDGTTYLRVSDTGNDTGEAGRVAIGTNSTDLDFSAPTKLLAFQVNGDTFTLDVAADTSLSQLADLINDDSANPGVTASIIDDGSSGDSFKLVLQANSTGADQEISFLAYLPDVSFTLQGETGDDLNAQITVDGIDYQRQSNTITDVLSGVSLSLQGAGSSTVSVGSNNEEVTEFITTMVTAYNDVVQEINGQVSYDETTEAFGLLAGTTVRDIPFALQNLMTGSSSADTTGMVENLFDLGLGFERDGSITLDETKLNAMIADHPDAIQDFFTGSTSSIAIPQLEATTGVIDAELVSIADSDGTFVIRYGAGVDDTITVDLTAGDSLNDIVSAINLDDENDGNGSNGRLLTASTYTTDGTTYLRLESDNSSGVGDVSEISIDTNGTNMTFGTSTDRYSYSSIDGFADKVNDYLRTLTSAVGQVAAEKTGAQQRVDDLNLKIEEDTARLDKRYDLMAQQFVALDSYMSQMTSIANYLTGQFSSLSDGWGQVGGKS